MHANRKYSALRRFTAILLAVVMVFTGAVAPGISSWTGGTVYADASWEDSYLDVRDGTMTKGELYDSFVAQFGTGSYKYAEEKPKYGWATGGTEVTSGNTDMITLETEQSYAVGKKGRYTWTAGTDYSFTARVYYVLTSADADITVENGSKVYAGTEANITITAKEGYHAQVWFDDKLQMTIEDGMTAGTFVPQKSGEVSVVYVEAAKPKHLVALNVIGDTYGTASLDFSGEQQEGTPISLTAVPAADGYIADIAIEGGEFSVLSGFHADRGKSGAFTVAEEDITVTVTFAQQTTGFSDEAAFDEAGNLKLYINTTGAFDTAHIEDTLYSLLAVEPGEAKPASLDQVKIQYLSTRDGSDGVWRNLNFDAPEGDWAWLNPAYGYTEFPKKAGETATVRISWDAGSQYPAGSIEQQIVLADHRIPTTIQGTDTTIVYGASDEALREALKLRVVGADGLQPVTAEELTVTYEGELNVDGSPHKVTVSYAGNEDYQPAEAVFQVTVKKAPCTINYDSQVVVYGDPYDFQLQKNPADVDTINFMIGLDGAVGETTSYLPVTQVYIELPASLDALDQILDMLLDDEKTVSLSRLLSALTKITDSFGPYLEEAGVSAEAVEIILNTLNTMTENTGALDNVKVTINPEGGLHPTNIGVYLAGAVTADNNYETAYTADYLIVVPRAAKAELKYRFEGINGIVTRNLIADGIYDLGVDAYVDGAFHQDATDDVAHLFLFAGADGKANVIYAASNEDLINHINSGELTKPGTYEQVSFMPVANEMYYALPKNRTYTVLEDAVNVEFIDDTDKVITQQKFTYDGQPKGMDVRVSLKDGTVLPNDEHLTVRYIGVDAKGIEFYNDTERPSNVGVYTVIATYMDQETDRIGMAAGRMIIEAGPVVIDVVDGTFEYDENYTVQVETTPAGMEKIVVIVGMTADGDIIEGEVGMINVDFPKRIDTLMKIAMPYVYYNGVNMQDLMDLIDKIKNIVELAGLDAGVIDQLTGTITSLMGDLGIDPAKADITFKDTETVKPLPVGMYTAVGISCDINHEIGVMNMGMITIVEKSIEQRRIVITAEDTTKTYGDKDPDFQWKYEIIGKTENAFYEGDDFDAVIKGGAAGVQIVNMAGEDADTGVYADMLYPTAYMNPEYQKYYTIEVKRGDLTVVQKDFSGQLQITGVEDKTYTGYAVTQKNLTVKLGKKTLIAGTDYEVSYINNVNAGEATVIITGIGNYKGTADAAFTICPRLIADADVSQIGDQTYTGEAVTPDLAVVVDGITLIKGEHYTVAFENNTDAGQAKAVITGTGNYTTDDGSKKTIEKNFEIKPAEIAAEIEKKDFVYDGTAKEPKVTVKDAVRDVDYTVTYENNVNAGKGTVIVEGKGNFTGRSESVFTIEKAPLTISVQPAEKVYGEPNPEFQVQYEGLQGSDTADVVQGLKLQCVATETSPVGSYLIAAGGASAENYDIRYVDGRLTIKARSLSDAVVSGPELVYNGKIQKPSAKDLTVMLDGVKLKENVDFQVTGYANNYNAGTATVSIKGIGNYKDTVKGQFEIVPAQLPAATLEYQKITYDGKEKKPAVSIEGLQEDADFTVAYRDNTNAGTASVVITGMGNYGGTIEKTFTIEKARDSITLSISGWTYGDPANSPDGKSASGNPVTYQYLQGTKVLEGVPSDAGTYYVRATVADTENYIGAFVQRPFTIAKRSISDEKIVVSEIANERYNGGEIKPEVTVFDSYRNEFLDGDDYTVTYRDNQNVGAASVIITAKGNYKDTITKTFDIAKMENSWTTPLSMEGWTCGDTSNEPKAVAAFGVVEYCYFDSDGSELACKPEAEGTYYVKAFVAEGDSYLGLESEAVCFVIGAANTDNPGEDPGTDPGNKPDPKPEEKPDQKPEDEPGHKPGKNPDKKPGSGQNVQPQKGESGDDNSPDTGDRSPLAVWIGIFAAALAGACALLYKRRSNKGDDK